MSTKTKFYYSKPKDSNISYNRNRQQIIKWAKEYVVEVNEQLDHSQYLELNVNKFKGETFPKPKSTECDQI